MTREAISKRQNRPLDRLLEPGIQGPFLLSMFVTEITMLALVKNDQALAQHLSNVGEAIAVSGVPLSLGALSGVGLYKYLKNRN